MLRLRKSALAALLFAIAPFSASARAQALELAPADALAVFRIKHVSSLSTKAGKLFTDLGVVQLKPAMGDPLKAFEDKSGIKEGLNAEGDAAAVLLNGKTASGQEKAYMLIPISDYAKFKSNFADAKDDGELTLFHFKNDTRDHYMANWGAYAAIAPEKEIIAAKPTSGLKLSGNAAKEVEAKDAALYANIVELRKIAIPAMEKGKKQFLEMFDKGAKGAAGAKQMQAMVKAALTRYIDVAEGYMRDADSAVVSFNLTDAGVNIAVLSDFQPESYSGKLVSSLKGNSEPLLTGLPGGTYKYIVYGGGTMDPKVSAQIVNDFVGPLLQDMNSGSADPKAAADMTKAIESLKVAAASTTGATIGIVAPRSQIGAESLYQGIEVIHGDSKAFMNAMHDLMPAMANAMNAAPAAAGANPPAGNENSFKVDSKPNAKTIDGVSFDQYTLNFTINPKTPEEAQMAQAIAFIYGPNGLNYYNGAIDNKTALLTFGINEKVLTDATAAAKKNEDVLGQLAQVKAVDAQLPKSRVAAGYFAADELVNTVVFYAKQFGMPVNMQLPPDLQPIAGVISNDGASLRADITIPTQLVQSITAAVLQTMAQMQGGGGQQNPPNGGGL